MQGVELAPLDSSLAGSSHQGGVFIGQTSSASFLHNYSRTSVAKKWFRSWAVPITKGTLDGQRHFEVKIRAGYCDVLVILSIPDIEAAAPRWCPQWSAFSASFLRNYSRTTIPRTTSVVRKSSQSKFRVWRGSGHKWIFWMGRDISRSENFTETSLS